MAVTDEERQLVLQLKRAGATKDIAVGALQRFRDTGEWPARIPRVTPAGQGTNPGAVAGGMRGAQGGAAPDEVSPDLETRNATMGGNVALHPELANIPQWEDASATARSFARGVGDATTLGLANRFLDAPEGERADAQRLAKSPILNKARLAGNVLGSVVPVGAAGLAGRAASRATGVVRGLAMNPATAPVGRFAVNAAGRALGGATEGALAGGAVAGGQELVRSGSPADALRAAGEGAVGGAKVGGLVGGLVAPAAGALAGGIRGLKGPIGEDIRVTEQYGGRLSPIPGRPIVGQSATGELGVQATSAGRGTAGEVAASRANEALDVRTRLAKQRLDAESTKALAAHGQQQAAIDPLMQDIQAAMGNKALQPATVGELDRLGKELEGMNQPQPMGSAPTILNAAGAPARGAQAAVGRAQISVQDLHGFKQRLDKMAGIAKEGGLSLDEAAFLGLSNRVRDIIRNEAPAVSLADKRYSANMRKTETTRERMRSQNDETFGGRLAGQGEVGSKVTGVREPGLAALRRQFPTDTGYHANAQFDLPRRVLAEERVSMKVIPRLRGGLGDATNIAEPVIARGVYPAARELSGLSPGQLAIQSNLLMRAAARRRQMEGR